MPSKNRPICQARDNARRCRRRSLHRYAESKDLCGTHYNRASKFDGETRTRRELRGIAARAKRRELLIRLGKGIRR